MNLGGKRRRSDDAGQDTKTVALRSLHGRSYSLSTAKEFGPCADLAVIGDRLSTIRIV